MFKSGACCSYLRREPHLRQFSAATTTKPKKDNDHLYYKYIVAATASTALIGASVYTRYVRDDKLSHLVSAKDCGLFSRY